MANVIGFIALTWWGEYVARVSLFYGAVTIKTLLLLAGCSVALYQLRAGQRAVVGSVDVNVSRLAA